MATNTGDSHPAVGHADPSLKEHSPVCKCEIRSVAPMGRPTSTSKKTWCFNVHRNHPAYWGRGEGGKGGMEVREEGDYIPIATLTPPE